MGYSRTVTVCYAELEESIYNLNEAMNSVVDLREKIFTVSELIAT